MRNQITYHAPYIYLTNNGQDNSYQLFIAVPIKADYQFDDQQTILDYRNGTTAIALKIRKMNGGNAAPTVSKKHFDLQPQAGSAGTFNPDSDEILITVSVYRDQSTLEEEFTAVLLYKDTDNQSLHADAKNDQIAYNCPYIYLEEVGNQVTSDSGQSIGGIFTYEPYLMLSPKGYTASTDQVMITSPDNGIYEATVFLTQIEQNGSEGYFIHDFQANREQYFDAGRVEGNFTARVILESESGAISTIETQPLNEINRFIVRIDDESQATARNGNARTPGPRSRVKKRATTRRNMSSRRRSPSFLDIRP